MPEQSPGSPSWYVAQNNQSQAGPFSWPELYHMAVDGTIRPETYVRHVNSGVWQRADSVPGLCRTADPEPVPNPAPHPVATVPSLQPLSSPGTPAAETPGEDASEKDLPTLSQAPSLLRGSLVQPQVQFQFPGYQIVEELGHGGMGVVYKANQPKLKRLVALKMILAPGRGLSEGERRRFQTEVQAVARLSHPGIVRIYEVDECQGVPYYSMEYCPNGTLHARLKNGPLPPDEAAQYLAILARAMHEAHQQSIIHRDLKPANILFGEDNSPRIADFGLAKDLDETGQTQTNAILGTPSYMSPEQARGATRDVGPHSDVYGLGAIFYEMIVGRPPFQAASLGDILDQVRNQEPVSLRQLQPKTPRDLETICLKCLNKEPRKRYESAKALAEDLDLYLLGKPVKARPVGRWGKTVRWAKRNPVVASLMALILLLLMAAAGGAGYGLYKLDKAATRATIAANNAEQAAAEKEEQRKKAEKAAAEKEEERKKAEKVAQDLEKQQEGQSVRNGWREYDVGDVRGAMVWFAEALGHSVKDSRDEMLNRVRLGSLLRQQRLEHVWFQVRSATFSPDNRYVAVTDDLGTASVWEVATGIAVSQGLKHNGPVLRAWFSPDSKTVFTSCVDGLTRVWEVGSDSDKPKWTWKTGVVPYLAFQTSEQKALVVTCTLGSSGGDPGEVRFWDTDTGKAVGTAQSIPGEVRALSKDGRYLLAQIRRTPLRVAPELEAPPSECQPAEEPNLDLWKLDPVPKKITSIRADLGSSQGIVQFSPDGKYFVTAPTSQQYVGNTPTEMPTPAPMKMNVPNAPKGTCGEDPESDQQFINARSDSQVWIWSSESGKQAFQPLELGLPISQVTFSADSQTLAIGGAVQIKKLVSDPRGFNKAVTETRGTIKTWRFLKSREPVLLRSIQPQQGVESLALSPDGRWVVAMSPEGTAQGWSTFSRGDVVFALLHHQQPFAVESMLQFSPDGRMLLSATEMSSNGEVRLWGLTPGGAQSYSLADSEDNLSGIYFSADEKHVFTGPGTTQAWELDTGKKVDVSVLPQNERVWEEFTYVDYEQVLKTRTVRRYLSNGRVVDREFTYSEFVPVEKKAARLRRDAKLWKSLGETSQRFNLPGRVGIVENDRFKGLLVTRHLDRREEARVWNGKDLVPLTPPLMHKGEVRAACFSKDGKLVVITCNDDTFRVWDVQRGLPVTPPIQSPNLNKAWISPDGTKIVASQKRNTPQEFPVLEEEASAELTEILLQAPNGGGSGAGIRVWNLEPFGDFSAKLLLKQGKVTYDRRIDSTGSVEQMGARQVQEEWESYLLDAREQNPLDTQEKTQRWHECRAEECARIGLTTEAITHLDVALRVQPNNSELYLLRGEAHASMSNWDQAYKDFEKGFDPGKASLTSWVSFALLKLKANQEKDYRTHCRDMVKKFTDVTEPLELHQLVAACVGAPNALETAGYEDLLLKVRAIRGSQDPRWSNLFGGLEGILLYRLDRYRPALPLLRPANSYGPNNDALQLGSFRALCLWKMDEKTEARKARQWVPTLARLSQMEREVLGREQPGFWVYRLYAQLIVQELEGMVPGGPPGEIPVRKPFYLWDSLGGETTLRKIVDDWVLALLVDDKLKVKLRQGKEFGFKEADLLKTGLLHLISSVSDGPWRSDRAQVKKVYQGMNFTRSEFDQFFSLLAQVLDKHGISPQDARNLKQKLEQQRDLALESSERIKGPPRK